MNIIDVKNIVAKFAKKSFVCRNLFYMDRPFQGKISPTGSRRLRDLSLISLMASIPYWFHQGDWVKPLW